MWVKPNEVRLLGSIEAYVLLADGIGWVKMIGTTGVLYVKQAKQSNIFLRGKERGGHTGGCYSLPSGS